MPNKKTRSFLPVEQIIKLFYTAFRDRRTAFHALIQRCGERAESAESEDCTAYILNRLLFLYFLQKKGLLANDMDYLRQRLRMMQAQQGQDSFYQNFLLPLFSEGFTNPQRTPQQSLLFGAIPYLAPGLFCSPRTGCDPSAFQIPDAAFELIFAFFDTYQWQLDEQAVQDKKTINPVILGYICEQYVNQQQMGAYYTQVDVTEYIAKNTIIPYLFEAVAEVNPAVEHNSKIWQNLQVEPDRYIAKAIRCTTPLPGETAQDHMARRSYYATLHSKLVAGEIAAIDDLITNNLDICQFAQVAIAGIEDRQLLQTYYEQMKQMTILDPTCGSGAFLFAALNILIPLYKVCLERMQTIDYEVSLTPTEQQPGHPFALLQLIITHNLYGVDIMEEATEICKLRLLLALMAQVEQVAESKELLTLHDHICMGNILADTVNESEIVNRERLTQKRQKAWYEAFEKVIQRGGFQVILGNPPYVEYSEGAFSYTLHNFVTLPCANLYPCVVERSYQLLAPQGRQGMILPLAAFATRNMLPLSEGFRNWFPGSWLSFYHFRPSMLFAGSKVASIPTAIYLAKTKGPEQRFSTRLNKWSQEEREHIFSLLTYSRITAPRDPANLHYYAKFGQGCENAILEKILKQQKIGNYLASKKNQNVMHYRSAGGLYWKVFVNFAWPYETTSNKQCSFQAEYDRDVFVAVLNSSLFWWYYTVTFDTFNLKDYMLFGFRFSYPQDATIVQALKQKCQQLMDNYRLHAKHLKRSKTGSYTIYARKAKPIIDEIDILLGQHYGFSVEEVYFIINYDSKYRLGQGSNKENV